MRLQGTYESYSVRMPAYPSEVQHLQRGTWQHLSIVNFVFHLVLHVKKVCMCHVTLCQDILREKLETW